MLENFLAWGGVGVPSRQEEEKLRAVWSLGGFLGLGGVW